MGLPATVIESLSRRARNVRPYLDTIANEVEKEGQGADARILAEAIDVLQGFVDYLADVQVTEVEEERPGKQVGPTRRGRPPAAATGASEKSGHRHKFDDAGRCTVKRDGQPCPDVRRRSRGDAKAPTLSDVHSVAIAAAMTRHLRAATAAGDGAYCLAKLGPLDVLAAPGSGVEINCLDCCRKMEVASAGAPL